MRLTLTCSWGENSLTMTTGAHVLVVVSCHHHPVAGIEQHVVGDVP